MSMSNALRGAVFFTSCLPSFSRLGFHARQPFWRDGPRDFAGQRWIVTGASTGIGRQIALRAAEAGARVRTLARSAERLERLAAESPARLEPEAADLSSMAAVDALVERLVDDGQTIDVLVNNVGLMLGRREQTEEGLEKGFATNLLGPYRLTERLRQAGLLDGAVVINMSSGGMYNVALELDRLQGGRSYDGTLTYAYHKRGQVVLNRWWREQGLNSYVMHPGWADTPGVQTAMPEFRALTRAVLRSPDEGADTALWLAAERPPQAFADGIWFDRALRTAHLFPGTRGGAGPQELVNHLETCLATAGRDTRAARATVSTASSAA